MYQKTLDLFADLAASKVQAMRSNLAGFLIASAMAGAYVGIGILLIFTIGQTIDPSVRSLAMGASFGVALTLVVFAGSELFTGHIPGAAARHRGLGRPERLLDPDLDRQSGGLRDSGLALLSGRRRTNPEGGRRSHLQRQRL